MLSLGCGQRPTASLSQKNKAAVMDLVSDIASDSELVDRDLAWRIGKSSVYYRFSVDRILKSGGDSALRLTEAITSSTKGFLEHPTTEDKVNQCAKTSECPGRVTLTDICQSFAIPCPQFSPCRSGLERTETHHNLWFTTPLRLFRREAGADKADGTMLVSGWPSSSTEDCTLWHGRHWEDADHDQLSASVSLEVLPTFLYMLFTDSSSDFAISSSSTLVAYKVSSVVLLPRSNPSG